MPPSVPPTLPQRPLDTNHLLRPSDQNSPIAGRAQREKHSGIGPVVGIIIILMLLVLGGLYFWGASMNRKAEQLPFIPGDSPTQEIQ